MMARQKGKHDRPSPDPFRPGDPAAFARSLEERRRAAQGLERDLLKEVPLLYGSPDHGDPGIALAKVHREEMLRRNGGGGPKPSGSFSEVRLPFERTIMVLLALFALFVFFGSPD